MEALLLIGNHQEGALALFPRPHCLVITEFALLNHVLLTMGLSRQDTVLRSCAHSHNHCF